MEKEVFTNNQKQLAHFAMVLGYSVRIYILKFISEQIWFYNSDRSEDLPLAKSTLLQLLKSVNFSFNFYIYDRFVSESIKI